MAGALATLGIVYVVFDRALSVAGYYALVSGPLLILTVIFNPAGIAGRSRVVWDRLRRKRRPEPAPPVPDAEAVPAMAAAPLAVPTRVIGDVLLRTSEVTVDYGGLRAVNRVSIEVREGEIVGLIGPNGAGKTSFIDAITGFTPSSGQVYLLDAAPRRAGRRCPSRHWAWCARGSRSSCSTILVEDNLRVRR